MSLQVEYDKIKQAVEDNDVTLMERLINDEVNVNYTGPVSDIVLRDA